MGGQGSGNGGSSAPHAAAGLCDEVVTLWRLAALNPSLSLGQRSDLSARLSEWHSQCIERLCKARQTGGPGNQSQPRAVELEAVFPGFRPAMEACQLDWSNLALPGGVADLLKHRIHWGQTSAVWMPSKPACIHASDLVASFPSASECGACDDNNSAVKEDSLMCQTDFTSSGDLWSRDVGRKVLMPSERSPHSTLRPSRIKFTTGKSGLEDLDSTASDSGIKCVIDSATLPSSILLEDSVTVACVSQSKNHAAGVRSVYDEPVSSRNLDVSLSGMTLDGDSVQTDSNSVSTENKQEVRVQFIYYVYCMNIMVEYFYVSNFQET